MTDRELMQQALEALVHVWNSTPKIDTMIDAAIAALKDRLDKPTVMNSLTHCPSIIDSIADNLLQDHVELMTENKRLRESLREILHENYAPEHYTDETIEYEIEQGNMMMPAVKRAYALVGRDSHD